MILSGPEIVRLVERTRVERRGEVHWSWPFPQSLVIDPFDEERVGPNSYDVCLSPNVAWYAPTATAVQMEGGVYRDFVGVLDSRTDNPVERAVMPESGFLFVPGRVYLCSTVERTETHGLVPWLDGRSSVGRLGVKVHATAGRGDDGFCGHWTLEVEVVHPVILYPGMRIAQISFFLLKGERKPYAGRYQMQGPDPVPSRLWKGGGG